MDLPEYPLSKVLREAIHSKGGDSLGSLCCETTQERHHEKLLGAADHSACTAGAVLRRSQALEKPRTQRSLAEQYLSTRKLSSSVSPVPSTDKVVIMQLAKEEYLKDPAMHSGLEAERS